MFNVCASDQTLVKGITTRYALTHNLNIQTICDIFCPHTAHCLNRQQQTAPSSTKSVSFDSVRFEGVQRVLGSAFPFESAGEKCECFVRYGRRHVYLLSISYIVYPSSSAFIKIKNQNYANNLPPRLMLLCNDDPPDPSRSTGLRF